MAGGSMRSALVTLFILAMALSPFSTSEAARSTSRMHKLYVLGLCMLHPCTTRLLLQMLCYTFITKSKSVRQKFSTRDTKINLARRQI
ncbi:hypothetical protein ACE6H2_000552 [Prunus campanulata]